VLGLGALVDGVVFVGLTVPFVVVFVVVVLVVVVLVVVVFVVVVLVVVVFVVVVFVVFGVIAKSRLAMSTGVFAPVPALLIPSTCVSVGPNCWLLVI